MTLRAVLFDVGNTLLFLDYSRLARGVGEAVGHPLSAESLGRHTKAAALALERGDTTDRERATVYLETLFLLAGVPREKLDRVRDRLYELHQEKHLWSAMDPGTPDALARLRESGLKLGVVSNSDGRVDAALEAAGLRRYFQVVLDSQLVGIEKPDPRIFWKALEALDVKPVESLYVGDIYEVDVVGARRAGLDVVLLDPLASHEGKGAKAVKSISELAEMLLAADERR